MLILPAIAELSQGVAATLADGQSAALVGPPGSGTTSVAALIRDRSGGEKFLRASIDCRERQTWQEQMRKVEESLAHGNASLARTLVVDHVGDLDSVEGEQVCRAVLTRAGAPFHAVLWVGNLDVRALHRCSIPRLHATPRTHFMMPDSAPDDLVQVYRAIADARECAWGEAIIHFLLDWCGDDLALVVGASEYFHGNWETNIEDGTVADCLSRWLAEDGLVEEYRQTLQNLPDPCRDQLRLLGIGGKLHCSRRGIDQEVDDHVRRSFFQGTLGTNLLPGYYQFRNLTIRHLWSEIDGAGTALPPLALLRRSANARVNQLLQDIEWSLRQLLVRVLETLGIDESRARLKGVRIVERGITPEFAKKMIVAAQAQGGTSLQESVGKVLAQCRREAEADEHLWAKVCFLYRKEVHITDEQAEPPLCEVPAFMTLSELSSVLLSWQADLFSQGGIQGETLPAPERWKAYLARVQRLRNQTAHLRNVGFQDLEDLLADARAVRDDFRKGLKVLD